MSKGFTLVELLVVIAIIGVLATLVLLQLGTARARARDTKRIADVNQIRTAVEQYFEDHNGNYPTDLYSTDDPLAPKYITRMPYDPLDANKKYNYAYHKTGDLVDGYQIWANLEQNAAAISAAAHIDSTQGGWTAGDGATINAGDQAGLDCSTQSSTNPNQCIYDQGVLP